MPGLTQELRSSSILILISKDWTWRSNPGTIEPGRLVGLFASLSNAWLKIDGTS